MEIYGFREGYKGLIYSNFEIEGKQSMGYIYWMKPALAGGCPNGYDEWKRGFYCDQIRFAPNINNVSLLQNFLFAWDPMADDIVNGSAYALGKSVIVQRRA